VFTVSAADDRYVLFEAEEQGFVLPAACRMGCCTACAVKARAAALLRCLACLC
jgi:ferredoxin